MAASPTERATMAQGSMDGARGAPLPRYRWRGGPLSRAQWIAALTALAVCIGLGAVYLAYLYGSDVSPDSPFGYTCAIAGTLLLLTVGVGYWLRKRVWKHHSLPLHTLLAWHVAGSVVGLLLIVMHATGNFNARTGTYALVALVALVVSGLVGRGLDRLAPWLAARAALRTLTDGGDERLDTLERELAAARSAGRRPATTRALARHQVPGGGPWDVAYFDLDPEVETIAGLVGGTAGANGAPSAKPTSRPVGREVRQREVRRQVAGLRLALAQEAFAIQLVRVWRRLHLLLSLAFVGLLAWHIVFALTLLLR